MIIQNSSGIEIAVNLSTNGTQATALVLSLNQASQLDLISHTVLQQRTETGGHGDPQEHLSSMASTKP